MVKSKLKKYALLDHVITLRKCEPIIDYLSFTGKRLCVNIAYFFTPFSRPARQFGDGLHVRDVTHQSRRPAEHLTCRIWTMSLFKEWYI